MYTPKFNYQPLQRVTVDGQRRYATSDGNKLPSVTTILSATQPEQKVKALNEWRRRVGPQRAQQITSEAAGRGTTMHKYLEDYITDGKFPSLPGNTFNHNSWHMAQAITSSGLTNCSEFWGVEVPLYYTGIYAGTTDCVGIHGGHSSIIDFKQTNKPKRAEWIEDYYLQLAAYSEAHNHAYDTDIRRGVIMMSVKPETDGATPQYQEFILEGERYEHYRQLWWQRVEQYYLKHPV